MKNKRGISLIVLVITILVMIILAGVVVVTMSQNNPIEKAKQAEFLETISAYKEELAMYIANTLAENTATRKSDIDAETYADVKKLIPSFANKHTNSIIVVDGTLVYNGENKQEISWAQNAGIACMPKDAEVAFPHLGSMQAIKYEGAKEVETNILDTSWFNYANKQWANAKARDGSYYVWIPRFAYKITYYDAKVTNNTPNGNVVGYSDARGYVDASGNPSTSFSRANGVIDVVFLGTGNNKYSYKKDGQFYGDCSKADAAVNPENYIVHPAFSPVRRNGYNKSNLPGNYGAVEELDGFWIAKFEMNAEARSIPGVETERHITINDIFQKARNMQIAGLDSMNMTNTQFGAVCYLSVAKGEMPEYNSNAECIAGTKDYTKATNLSTTKNVTGVYDLHGAAWEYISGYVNTNAPELTKYAQSLVNSCNTKYVDVYRVNSAGDDSNANYTVNSDKYGDAIFETSINGIYGTNNSWHAAKSSFPMRNIPAMGRGGTAYGYDDSFPGLFAFGSHYGNGEIFMGWRAVLI